MEEVMDFVPEKGFYQPSTDESWESYQALISVVEQQLGGFPRAVICGAADEILGIFRNRYLTQVQKRFEVERLIGIVSIDFFNQLVLSTNEICDYNRAKPSSSSSSSTFFSSEEKEQAYEQEEKERFFYQPRSCETWMAYNMLLDAVVRKCGVQPQLVLCCAANELLAVLKNENVKEEDLKKQVIGNILGVTPISDKLLRNLVAIAGLITDYSPGEVVSPTDVIREEDVMMMMNKEVKKGEVIREMVCEEEEEEGIIWQSSQWSDEEEEDVVMGLLLPSSSSKEEEDPMVTVEDENVGPMEEDMMVRNENVGSVEEDDHDDPVAGNEDVGVEEYLLVRDVEEKLVLNKDESNEVNKKEEDEDEYEDEWVIVECC